MFSAYNRFEKPELKAASLAWAASGERLVFLDTGESENGLLPEKRLLTSTELDQVKEKMDKTGQKQDFGRFVSGATLTALKGWCHFKLNQALTEARLNGLLLDPALSDLPPLQNPALH